MNISVIVLAGYNEPRQLPKARQVIVVKNKKGRGYGIVEGLKQVTGEVTLVLHADTTLPENWQEEVRELLATGTTAGAFHLDFDRNTFWTRLGKRAMKLHFDLRQEVWGDCAQFARTKDWKHIAQGLDVPLMEDVIFCQEMKRIGNIALAPSAIETSARKLRQPLRFAWKVLRLRLQFAWGVSPEILYKKYYSEKI